MFKDVQVGNIHKISVEELREKVHLPNISYIKCKTTLEY
jgi:hypothetical protein